MGNIIEKNNYIDGIGPWYWDDKDNNGWDAPLEDWENGLKDVIKNMVTNKGTVVQAGGMLGMYPRLMSELFTNVYTFEPNKYNYSILSLNCNKDNIKHFNLGLSDKICKSEMKSLSDINLGMKLIPNNIIPKYGFEETLEEIDLITIDSLELDSCDLIQLDIERHEIFALRGAVKTIDKFKPVIIVETNIEDNKIISEFMFNINYVPVKKLKNDLVYLHKNKITKEVKMKKILLAIPTNKNIENECTMSITNLKVPHGYTLTVQQFFGYAVDQVRNLIADTTIKQGYDYVFCVDSDMEFPPDTLLKLLIADKPIVSATYRQRNISDVIIEIYEGYNVVVEGTPQRFCTNINSKILQDYIDHGEMCYEVDACGFGCVLIKREVLEKMEYPHFFYKQSIDFKDTVSEDVYFCNKAKEAGFSTYFIPTLKIGHVMKLTIYP